MRTFFIILIAASAVFSAAQAAETYAARSLSYESASNIVEDAVTEARKNNRNVAIIVIDGAGEVIASARMDGARPAAMTLAERKAKTALLFRGASRTAMEEIDEGKLSLLSLEPLAALPGGLAVNLDGEFIGAVGVSGAPADIDEAIAAAGLKSFKD